MNHEPTTEKHPWKKPVMTRDGSDGSYGGYDGGSDGSYSGYDGEGDGIGGYLKMMIEGEKNVVSLSIEIK